MSRFAGELKREKFLFLSLRKKKFNKSIFRKTKRINFQEKVTNPHFSVSFCNATFDNGSESVESGSIFPHRIAGRSRFNSGEKCVVSFHVHSTTAEKERKKEKWNSKNFSTDSRSCCMRNACAKFTFLVESHFLKFLRFGESKKFLMENLFSSAGRRQKN